MSEPACSGTRELRLACLAFCSARRACQTAHRPPASSSNRGDSPLQQGRRIEPPPRSHPRRRDHRRFRGRFQSRFRARCCGRGHQSSQMLSRYRAGSIEAAVHSPWETQRMLWSPALLVRVQVSLAMPAAAIQSVVAQRFADGCADLARTDSALSRGVASSPCGIQAPPRNRAPLQRGCARGPCSHRARCGSLLMLTPP